MALFTFAYIIGIIDIYFYYIIGYILYILVMEGNLEALLLSNLQLDLVDASFSSRLHFLFS